MAGDFRDLDALASHNAFVRKDGKPLSTALLGLLNADSLRIDASSSPAMASIAMLYDAEPGNLRAAETFLAFDGPRAHILWHVSPWRRVDRVAFTAVEPVGSRARVRLVFATQRSEDRELDLSRKTIDSHGDEELVEYASGQALDLPEGVLRLEYGAAGSYRARLGEFIVDDIGRAEASPRPELWISTLDEWKARFATSLCADLRREYVESPPCDSRQALRKLLGPPIAGTPTKLVYWRAVENRAAGFTTHALILKVDDTRHVLLDFVRAWLVVPHKRAAPLPLVILPQQSHLGASQEALGVFGEKELGISVELALHGVASLTLDSYAFGTPFFPKPRNLLQHYPFSSATAKELQNLRRALDLALDATFQQRAGVTFDVQRIGMWGFSYGAWITLLAALDDERIQAVAFLFQYRDKDIVPGLAASLYIPQLACLEDLYPEPLSVNRMLREYHQQVFAIASDAGLLEEWTRGLEDPRVTVVVNPYGHVVTEQTRAAVLNFLYRAFSMPETASPRGARHELPREPAAMAPFVERENRWRTEIIKALSAP